MTAKQVRTEDFKHSFGKKNAFIYLARDDFIRQ